MVLRVIRAFRCLRCREIYTDLLVKEGVFDAALRFNRDLTCRLNYATPFTTIFRRSVAAGATAV